MSSLPTYHTGQTRLRAISIRLRRPASDTRLQMHWARTRIKQPLAPNHANIRAARRLLSTFRFQFSASETRGLILNILHIYTSHIIYIQLSSRLKPFLFSPHTISCWMDVAFLSIVSKIALWAMACQSFSLMKHHHHHIPPSQIKSSCYHQHVQSTAPATKSVHRRQTAPISCACHEKSTLDHQSTRFTWPQNESAPPSSTVPRPAFLSRLEPVCFPVPQQSRETVFIRKAECALKCSVPTIDDPAGHSRSCFFSVDPCQQQHRLDHPHPFAGTLGN